MISRKIASPFCKKFFANFNSGAGGEHFRQQKPLRRKRRVFTIVRNFGMANRFLAPLQSLIPVVRNFGILQKQPSPHTKTSARVKPTPAPFMYFFACTFWLASREFNTLCFPWPFCRRSSAAASVVAEQVIAILAAVVVAGPGVAHGT
jgi:hypothetical protein